MAVSENVLMSPPGFDAGAEEMWRYRCYLESYYNLYEGDEDLIKPRRHRLVLKTVETAIKLTGLWRRGRANALRPALREDDLRCPGLPPALDGLRMLHLSDFHLREKDPAFLDVIAGLLDGVSADICFITGDYCYGHYGIPNHLEADVAKILSGITAPLGFYGVLGNHDKSTFVSRLENTGIRMLVNEGTAIHIRDEAVWLGGVDDAHLYRCDNVPAALNNAPENAFKILLAHSSESVGTAHAAGAQLYLCGHSHGGQLCLPVVGALRTHTRSSRAYLAGHWNLGGMTGYTTTGLGVSDIPVRFNCRGEAVLFTLRAG